MHRYFFPALALGLAALAVPVRAAEVPQGAPEQPATKVWTNEDLDELRARGLISIVPVEAPAATTPAAQPFPVYASRLQDPAWYSEQAAELQAQLDANMAALREAREGLAQARSLRQATGGINMQQGNAGVTPEEGIAILEARVSQVQSELNELADLARRNYIPPGALRPAAA